MLRDFLTFIKGGNVPDLAVAVIVGGAFGGIVSSLVEDIIMPVIGVILQGVDFTGPSLTFGKARLAYGNFVQAVVNFFSDCLCCLQAPAAPQPSPQEELLKEIRDILKKR